MSGLPKTRRTVGPVSLFQAFKNRLQKIRIGLYTYIAMSQLKCHTRPGVLKPGLKGLQG